jgi:hypothetical protein
MALSSWISVPGNSWESFLQADWPDDACTDSTHHTLHEPLSVQHDWLGVGSPTSQSPVAQANPCLRLHLISDLLQLAARMHHPPNLIIPGLLKL